jgi:hypothetical protein
VARPPGIDVCVCREVVAVRVSRARYWYGCPFVAALARIARNIPAAPGS